jgi:hypothetical protein
VSFQVYLQPLMTTLRYHDLKELARSRTYEFVPVQSGDISTDTIGSLRGNAVLRWEYRPGSTLFLVWTQERSQSDTTGEFDFRSNVADLTRIQPNNVYLVKLSYYWSR